MTISIIGGGIGGLTAGIALKSKGYKVVIYESANKLKTVGAGIILGCNAMQVYQHLGLDKQMADKGNAINSMSVTDHNLKNLTSLTLDYFVDKYKIGNYAIHRADLHQILLDQFEEGEVVFGKRLDSLNQETLKLHFDDGSDAAYEILIGADGIHSKVREFIFPGKSKIRKAGQLCWRGVVDYQLPDEYKNEFREAWGLGNRVGHGQINEGQVYWFALINYKGALKDYNNANWKKLFSNFDPLLQELISNTDDGNIHLGEMTELEQLDNWYNDNVCLIGDAAHAMTPNMGQGAGQSIEDAWALANAISEHNADVRMAFPAFQKYRKKKVSKIVSNSWHIGNISQLESPFWLGFRNAAMRVTPAFLGKSALKETFEI